MSLNIGHIIKSIDLNLLWLKKHQPEQYERRFLQLVERRRLLRRIADTLESNPTIATWGTRWCGKNSLINRLFQTEHDSFSIKVNKKTYRWSEFGVPECSESINHSVVRFTSYTNSPERYSEEYPIMMRSLSVADIIIILSEVYYHNITDYTIDCELEIIKHTQDSYEKYKSYAETQKSVITADDILDIKAYLETYINSARPFLKTRFFETLALIANRIPANDIGEVFSILWNKNSDLTRLFSKLLDTLVKLKFNKMLYLPVEALLHDGWNGKSMMDFYSLYNLFSPTPNYLTDVYIREGDNYIKLPNFTISELSAVCAEVIVKIDEDNFDRTECYNFDRMDKNITSLLNNGMIKTNQFLYENDLLELPSSLSCCRCSQIHLKEDVVLASSLLRGKVAYLFKMYNDSKRINVLLYCHDHNKNEVAEIPLLLQRWILNNVGRTMEERKQTLSLTDQISPLFYIGTKFNIDMSPKPEVIANEVNALNGRWYQRFTKVLYTECFNADGNLDNEKQKIFLNWTQPNEHFTNSYILRDFKFSGPMASRLYDLERTENSKMLMPEDYYNRMRSTFCESDHVKCFFKNPELAWDVCASKDNDGALYIIEQLNKIGLKLRNQRQALVDNNVNNIMDDILNIMEEALI